jgi:hypothetical protein
MRAVAGVMAPFGIVAGAVYVFLIVPTLIAAAGTWLLYGYHRIATGQPTPNRWAVWIGSLLFNAPGTAFLFNENWWLGLWPLVACGLSIWAMWSEVSAEQRALAKAMADVKAEWS